MFMTETGHRALRKRTEAYFAVCRSTDRRARLAQLSCRGCHLAWPCFLNVGPKRVQIHITLSFGHIAEGVSASIERTR